MAGEIVAADPALAYLSPKEFMLAVMRTPYFPVSTRLAAAAKPAPYEHDKLASVDPNQGPNDPYAGKTPKKLNALFIEELTRRGYRLVPIEDEPEPPAGLAPPRGSNGSGGSQY